MSTTDFWICTPRKLQALLKVHVEVNNPGKKGSGFDAAKPQTVYIDQVLF